MEYKRDNKLKKAYPYIIMAICLVAIFIGLGFFINYEKFHSPAIQGQEGWYEPLVYVTPYGECYHREHCSYITTKREIGLYQAQDRGYRACQHCGGGSSEEILVGHIEARPEENNYLAAFGIASIPTLIIGFIWLCVIFEKEENEKKIQSSSRDSE